MNDSDQGSPITYAISHGGEDEDEDMRGTRRARRAIYGPEDMRLRLVGR